MICVERRWWINQKKSENLLASKGVLTEVIWKFEKRRIYSKFTLATPFKFIQFFSNLFNSFEFI